MADYISRAAAIEKITFLCELREIVCNPDDEFLRGLKNALNAVKSNEVIPSADVQPIDRWISVDDRLPKEQECVIVHEKDYGVMLGDYQGIKYSQPVWIVRKSGLIIRTTEVTHWRYLPKTPNE